MPVSIKSVDEFPKRSKYFVIETNEKFEMTESLKSSFDNLKFDMDNVNSNTLKLGNVILLTKTYEYTTYFNFYLVLRKKLVAPLSLTALEKSLKLLYNICKSQNIQSIDMGQLGVRLPVTYPNWIIVQGYIEEIFTDIQVNIYVVNENLPKKIEAESTPTPTPTSSHSL